jgi:hypothetical protein
MILNFQTLAGVINYCFNTCIGHIKDKIIRVIGFANYGTRYKSRNSLNLVMEEKRLMVQRHYRPSHYGFVYPC